MKNTLVLKYGGSSVATPEKIKDIASHLKELKTQGKNLVVVLSAMGKTTNNLISLASEFATKPNKRDLDFLLSTGEMQTISLMSICLNELGISSVALTGFQAGIITNDNHSFAFIKHMKIKKVKEYLKQNKVVLVAGFQGKTNDGEITTLGRGGSDTTAVALASSLNCPCEIYTDVEAVKTVDPNIFSRAKSLNKISFDEMMEMAVNGAKVLEPRSVELAYKFSTPLYLGKTLSKEKNGTNVIKQTFEDMPIKNISVKDNYCYVSVSLDNTQLNDILKLITNYNLNYEMLSKISTFDSNLFSFALPKSCFNEIKNDLLKMGIKDIYIEENVTKISIIGIGIATHTDILKKVITILNNDNISPKNLTLNEINISFLVEEKFKNEIIKNLSKEFDL